jgi:aldehyde:ferredoxin oxidoreductase
MKISDTIVVTAGKKLFKKAYVGTFLWFTGRAIAAAAKVDAQVKHEFAGLPDNFSFALGVLPAGPWMVVGKKGGTVKYLGADIQGQKLPLRLAIKNIEAAMLLLTFQESTALATARNRLIINGEIPYALAVIRILDIVEVYLLPKIIARLAVKRYPAWWPSRRKYGGRALIYIRTLLGI